MPNIVKNGEKTVMLTAEFGQVMAKVKDNQVLAPVKAQIKLYERMGHIYKIASGRDGEPPKYSIAAAGYSHLNKVASISIVTPHAVIVDGRAVPNPHIERNPKTKAIESVNIRKMGIGYSPIGNVVVVDKTLFYNVYTYFIQSIQAKMKRRQWNKDSRRYDGPPMHPDAALYGIEGKEPEKSGSWAFFPTESPLGIWINYEDPAMIDCLEEHTQRQRFGDRIAQKIVERNILKDHPAIGISQVHALDTDSGQRATVEVFGYRNEMNPPDISEIMRQAERGGDPMGDVDLDGKFVVKADSIDATEIDEDEEQSALREAAEEDAGPGPDPVADGDLFVKNSKSKKG